MPDKETIPILFDTDIGSDIDDAVALAYLLNEPRCELLGITTVSGDTTQRAALAEIVCREGGRTDVPIVAGLTGPLLHGPGQPNVPQYAAVQNKAHRIEYRESVGGGNAVDFLRQTIRARPKEITLLAVGPLTNIAALFAADPEIPHLLERVVLMCGVFTGWVGHGPGAREWNALCDPIATGIVFRHAAPGTLLSVGLDVTTQCQLPADECRTRFQQAGGALSFVTEMAEVWFEHTPRITFHDPLAATLIFQPEICEYETGQTDVITDAGRFEGMTCWQRKNDGPHQIAAKVDADQFFARYFAVVNQSKTT